MFSPLRASGVGVLLKMKWNLSSKFLFSKHILPLHELNCGLGISSHSRNLIFPQNRILKIPLSFWQVEFLVSSTGMDFTRGYYMLLLFQKEIWKGREGKFVRFRISSELTIHSLFKEKNQICKEYVKCFLFQLFDYWYK